MRVLIICFVAGISTAAFVAIWFKTAYKELSYAKQCVESAAAQLWLHKESSPKARDGPDRVSAELGLDTARMIYHEVVKNYNAVRQRPMNRLPAWIFGYRPQSEGADL